MDEVARYNQKRWDGLSAVKGLLTRPDLGASLESVRERFEVAGRLGPVAGESVLCLGCGGGQQGCGFARLGAHVTVVDLSDAQLQADLVAAKHFGVDLKVVQADMRELSAFGEAAFDIVYQPYSINFVPDCRVVFGEVGRVLRPGGTYQLTIANPFTLGITSRDWNGRGYTLHRRYEQGLKLELEDEVFIYSGASGDRSAIPRPIEYRQTLGTILNGLIEHGFQLMHLEEEMQCAGEDVPGTFNHLKAYAPPWFTLWLTKEGKR